MYQKKFKSIAGNGEKNQNEKFFHTHLMCLKKVAHSHTFNLFGQLTYVKVYFPYLILSNRRKEML